MIPNVIEPNHFIRDSFRSPRTDVAGFTPTQHDTLYFWARFEKLNGYPPTMRDAASHFGTGMRTIHERVLLLVRKKAMHVDKDVSRGTTLTELGAYVASLPTGTMVEPRRCACGAEHFLAAEKCFSWVHGAVT